MKAASTRIVPEPIVEWTVLAATSNPVRGASRARYRTLTAKGLVSKGVTAPVMGRTGGLAGRQTFHSALSVLAIHAERAGDATGAAYLSEAASALEERFRALLTDFLTTARAEDLPSASFFDELVGETTAVLDRWSGVSDLFFATGTVVEVDSTDAHIQGTTTSGEAVEVLLPIKLISDQGIRRGEAVWVFRTMAGSAAVVEVLPALTVEQEESGGPMRSRQMDLDEASDQAEAAAEYSSELGSLPARDDLERLIATARDVPVRVIRVVG